MRLTVYPRIMETLQGLAPPTRPSNVRFALENYSFPVERWDPHTRTLILFGATNVGKTSLAKALLPRALMTRHLDPLVTYQSKGYKGIILDDMSFNSGEYTMKPEAQIHLLDREDDTQIHCRYRVAEIPAHTPTIITSNKHPTQVVALHDPAIERRCLCMLMVSAHEFHEYTYIATSTSLNYQRYSLPQVEASSSTTVSDFHVNNY